MNAPAEAYPLTWPPGRPRMPAHKRTRAKFHAQRRGRTDAGYSYIDRSPITLAAAVRELGDELARLGAKAPVISTNLRTRRDGLPYSDQRKPDDPGAAVYFLKDGRQLCFACDRWDRVEDNLVAVAKTIEALRGIERWGTGDMVQAAFTGFAAIAGTPARRAWWVVLKVSQGMHEPDVEAAYKRLAFLHHPDRNPGDPGAQGRMAEINGAWDDFKRERGL